NPRLLGTSNAHEIASQFLHRLYQPLVEAASREVTLPDGAMLHVFTDISLTGKSAVLVVYFPANGQSHQLLMLDAAKAWDLVFQDSETFNRWAEDRYRLVKTTLIAAIGRPVKESPPGERARTYISSSGRLIVQIRRKPPLDRVQVLTLPPSIVLDLIPGDFSHGEVFCVGMGKVEPTDCCGRHHRVAFGQHNPGVLFYVQEIKEQALLGMVRAGRISGSRPDASIPFTDQIFIGESFDLPVAPICPCPLVQIFRKCFGQTIRQGLRHD